MISYDHAPAFSDPNPAPGLFPFMTSAPSQPEPQLGKAMARGAGAMLAISLLTKGLGFAGQLVLAALLVPDDFGLVALTVGIIDTCGLIQKLGLREMITHRQRRLTRWLSPAIWIAGAGGFASASLLAVLSLIAPTIFDADSSLTLLIIVGAIGNAQLGFIETLESALAARLRFGPIARIRVGEVIVRTGLSVLFAALGLGAMSLILPRPIVMFLHTIALWATVRPKLSRTPQLRRWRLMIADSSKVFFSHTAQVVTRQGDRLLLGLFVGEAMLGAYFFAFGLSTQGVILLVQSLTGVLAAGLSKLQDEPSRQRRAFLDAIGVIALISVPLLAIQSASCEALLLLLYKDRWVDAIAPLQILSIGAAISAIGWNNNAMFVARGLFREQLIMSWIGAIGFLVVVTVSAWRGGPIAVAWGVVGYRAVYIPISLTIAAGGGRRTLGKALGAALGPALVATASIVPAWWLGRRVGASGDPIDLASEIVIIVTLGGALYWILARLLLRETYARFSARVRTMLPDRVSSRVPGWAL